MPSLTGWIDAHPTLLAGLCLGALFLLLNLLAYRHARAMTHLAPAGDPLAGGVTFEPSGTPEAPAALPPPTTPPDQVGLAPQVHRFAGAVGELEAWYLPHPCPRGLVLMFHGYKMGKAALLPEARAFHELGFACFLIDFPGSGGSGGRATTIGYREADDVVRAADYAHQHWGRQPLILYGQSMGSAAVLRALAVHRVRADAAVLECPFDRLVTTVGARIQVLGVPAFPYVHLMVFWGGLQHGFNAFAHNPVDYARRVRTPVLLLHGRCDPRVSCRHIHAIYRNLAGPKDLHFFHGLGHESYVARRPDEWKGRVEHFLAVNQRSAVQA